MNLLLMLIILSRILVMGVPGSFHVPGAFHQTHFGAYKHKKETFPGTFAHGRKENLMYKVNFNKLFNEKLQ